MPPKNESMTPLGGLLKNDNYGENAALLLNYNTFMSPCSRPKSLNSYNYLFLL